MGKVTEEFRSVDWSKLLLSVVVAALMLLVGRVWGETRIGDTVISNGNQASLNRAAVQALERRLDDHLEIESERYQEILSQLREIRMAVNT